MRKKVFLVVDKNIYFYKYEDDIVYPLKKGLLNRILFLLLKKVNLPFPKCILSDNLFDYDEIILTDSISSISLIKTLKKYYKEDNIFLYFMNVINNKNEHLIDLVLKKNIYTFDKKDAEKHSIKFRHTPYSTNVPFNDDSYIYDTVFLGREKNRLIEINKIANELGDRKIIPKMLVLDSKEPKYRIDTYLSYEKYLEYISKSKTILEIVENEQTGCTLRFMESLFLRKKLITNNVNIIDDMYYSEKNVFIFGRDSLNDIVEFINTPYVEESSIQNLDFSRWLSQF